jgi:FdrA protein
MTQMSESVVARRGAYADSVRLMQVSQQVASGVGVDAAIVAMATELNLELARGMGFELPAGVGPNDLLIALRAADEPALAAAIEAADSALRAKVAATPGIAGLAGAAGSGGPPAPRTTGAALAHGGNLALISVPGRYAFAEASDALAAGIDVMIFSDNVPVNHEVALKRRAGELGRLVMGPDCGTAVVGGVGLGFANAVRSGPVAIVAASGTGAQQLMSLLELSGVGISACLGVGGRDLSTAVGGRSTIMALDRLDADPTTELIVVVSKPPAAEVADRVRAHALGLAKPVLFGLLGPGEPDLTELAESILAAGGVAAPAWPTWGTAGDARAGGSLRGLYSGGTLCDEAMLIATSRLGEVRSNIPLRPEWVLGPNLRHDGHLMIDFGDDALTQGRPHPMIDATLRSERLALESADPGASVVLMDVVLGYGADPDPAARLAPAVADASKAGLAVVIALIGTEIDPQGLDDQGARFAAAGAAVFASNAAAARCAVELVVA